MDWNAAAGKLKTVLDLRKEPVGVKYTNELPGETDEGYYPVCGAILGAADGKTITLSKETCACPGGISHIGLSEGVRVSGKMLVEGEKLWANTTAFHRSSEGTRKIAEPPVGLGSNVVFYPLKADIYDPDLVIILANAEQGCRLVVLGQFWDGKLSSMELRGSLCWSSVTYPIVSGNLNVSLGDTSARRMENWPADLLLVSVPRSHVEGILSAMDFSTAGTAEPAEFFERMSEKIVSRRHRASDLTKDESSK